MKYTVYPGKVYCSQIWSVLFTLEKYTVCKYEVYWNYTVYKHINTVYMILCANSRIHTVYKITVNILYRYYKDTVSILFAKYNNTVY